MEEGTMTDRPSTRVADTLCQFDDGDLLYVSYDTHATNYESFKLYTGIGAQMEEKAILALYRYRDGGTTKIETSEGVFFTPQRVFPTNQPQIPTWTRGGIEEVLTYLDPQDYDIVEMPEGTVSITKR